MKLVLWILAGYVLYYIVLFIWDAMHNGVGDPDVEESQIIDVSDMAEGSNFQPKQMELSKEVREKYLPADDNKSQQTESQEKPGKVCGAMFIQGYEVESYDKTDVQSATARFDSAIRSV